MKKQEPLKKGELVTKLEQRREKISETEAAQPARMRKRATKAKAEQKRLKKDLLKKLSDNNFIK